MPGLDPSVAATRLAVRSALAGCRPGDLVLAACSGGADSLALAAALAVEGPRLGLRSGCVSVDHGLQKGSDDVAARALQQCAGLGLEPRVLVGLSVEGSGNGPEARARDARYLALDTVAEREEATAILLGHTRDDQAEQVLLGLVRGSGSRSLSGMPRARGIYLRPFLDLPHELTREACTAEGLQWWEDPHNIDPAFTRVRVRALLAAMEAELGPGIGAALARSADQLRDDADHLDVLAEMEVMALGPGPWATEEIAGLPRAVRTRVWRRLLLAAGAPAGQVSALHTAECDRLLTDWHGQGPVHVPGPHAVRRSGGQVFIEPLPPVE